MGTCPRSALSSAGDPRLYADEHAAALKLQPHPRDALVDVPQRLARVQRDDLEEFDRSPDLARLSQSDGAVAQAGRRRTTWCPLAPWVRVGRAALAELLGGGFSRDQARQGPTSNVPKGSWLRVRKKRNARCALRKA